MFKRYRDQGDTGRLRKSRKLSVSGPEYVKVSGSLTRREFLGWVCNCVSEFPCSIKASLQTKPPLKMVSAKKTSPVCLFAYLLLTDYLCILQKGQKILIHFHVLFNQLHVSTVISCCLFSHIRERKRNLKTGSRNF
jgi:hypothetical protein